MPARFVNTLSPLAPDLIDPTICQRLAPADYQDKSIQYIHEQLTKQELASSTPYLFLTGTPGTGKTTAIVKFLKERSMQGEGFLFLYASPRKQVNLDIIKKFRDDEFGLRCDNLYLLQIPPLEQAYLAGELLIVPIENHTLQEIYWMDVEKLFAQQDRALDLVNSMEQLSRDRRYPDSVHMVMKDALAFIKQLKKMGTEQTLSYEQESSHTDQHYAIPLLTFLAYNDMKAYFESKPEDETIPEFSFRSLLFAMVRALYPADSMLPIGMSYDVFPFVVFRSFNLPEARRKMFTDKYLFMSHEFNILNMLLSSKE